MSRWYVIDHDRVGTYLRDSKQWTCDCEPFIDRCRNAHDEHGCPGWKISAFCEDCGTSHRYFITRHEALHNGVAITG